MEEDSGKLPQHIIARRAALRVAPDTPHAVVDYEFHAVRQFMEKFGILLHDTPVHLKIRELTERIDLIVEEVEEFIEASMDDDLAKMADALVDLVYVAKGTAAQLGLPWEALMNDVHGANMRKERGQTKRGHAVDALKPPGWVGPQTELILEAAGYVRSEWIKEDGSIDRDKLKGYPIDVAAPDTVARDSA